jgi:sodium-dependent dicarboxylate transporter 2/3/5
MSHKYKNLFFLLIGITLAVLLFFLNPFHVDAKAAKVLSIAVLMVFLWVTESIPMAVVALLPMLLFPLLAIMPIKDAAWLYSDPIIYLFMGGFFLGLAIEKWNLHKRIAINIIGFMGCNGNRIILGFIIATGAISMWLSNTATTMMMFPIATSVIYVMQKQPGGNIDNFSIAIMLAIAYASNFGGVATIIGTPPNVAYVGYIHERLNYEVNFLKWMALFMPLSIILLILLYFMLVKVLYPNNIKHSDDTFSYIQSELKEMGSMSVPERRVMIIFIIMAALWIFQSLINKLNFVKLDDTIVALIGTFLLFTIPSGYNEKDESGNEIQKPVLVWKDTKNMAWGILLLFGGGLALAKGLEDAGWMTLLGDLIAHGAPQNLFLLILLVTTISLFVSELLSNVAQVIIFAPVVTGIAVSLHIDPLLLGLPMCLGASCAGMLPMGTPPNAIAFSSGHIKLKDMLRAGFIMNVLSILIISVLCYFFVPMLMKVE